VKRINTRLIKAKCAYFVETLAKLLSVHPNTLLGWIKEGLPRMDDSYPYVIWGADAIAFINDRQRKNKVSLEIDEFYCCKCHAPRKAWETLAELQKRTSKTGNLKAICGQCNTRLFKLVSLAKTPEIASRLTLLDSALVQPTNSSVKHETKGVENYAPK
jgi:hypothetical protein